LVADVKKKAQMFEGIKINVIPFESIDTKIHDENRVIFDEYYDVL